MLCESPLLLGATIFTTVGFVVTEPEVYACVLTVGALVPPASTVGVCAPVASGIPSKATPSTVLAPPDALRAISEATTHKPVFLFLTTR